LEQGTSWKEAAYRVSTGTQFETTEHGQTTQGNLPDKNETGGGWEMSDSTKTKRVWFTLTLSE
jgi:hypothetical protein